jgi:hypothetical protein
VVPARPGSEAALAHFLDTREIWDGADPSESVHPARLARGQRSCRRALRSKRLLLSLILS